MVSSDTVVIEQNATIPTWFHVGGRADRMARPRNTAAHISIRQYTLRKVVTPLMRYLWTN